MHQKEHILNPKSTRIPDRGIKSRNFSRRLPEVIFALPLLIGCITPEASAQAKPADFQIIGDKITLNNLNKEKKSDKISVSIDYKGSPLSAELTLKRDDLIDPDKNTKITSYRGFSGQIFICHNVIEMNGEKITYTTIYNGNEQTRYYSNMPADGTSMSNVTSSTAEILPMQDHKKLDMLFNDSPVPAPTILQNEQADKTPLTTTLTQSPDGPIVDVLIAYNQGVILKLGYPTIVQDAVDTENYLAYVLGRSGVTGDFQTFIGELPPEDMPNNIPDDLNLARSLSQVRDPEDGFADNVWWKFRIDRYDIAVVLVPVFPNYPDEVENCGRAYVPSTVAGSFYGFEDANRNSGVAVVNINPYCTYRYFILAHEILHVGGGAGHSKYQILDNLATMPDGKGYAACYQDPNNNNETKRLYDVMSYGDLPCPPPGEPPGEVVQLHTLSNLKKLASPFPIFPGEDGFVNWGNYGEFILQAVSNYRTRVWKKIFMPTVPNKVEVKEPKKQSNDVDIQSRAKEIFEEYVQDFQHRRV